MAESSSQNPSSPEITPKEEHVTLDKPESPNPFLPASQVDFTFDEITFTTNNEVALLYPLHPNQEYFKDVSDFISKCCLNEAFTRTPTQYKEYLSEFWYTTKSLEGYKTPKLQNPLHKLKRFPQGKKPKAKSGPRRKKSSKHTSESKNEASKSKTGQLEKDTQSSLTKDKSPSHPSPPTLVVGEMHKEAQQAVGSPTSIGAISEEGAHPQLSSDEPIIVTNESKEEEADKGDTHDTSHDVPKNTSVSISKISSNSRVNGSTRPFYLDIKQLTDLLVTSLKPELSKLLTSHNFASRLPTDLKELLSKFIELSREINELKRHVKDMEIELPRDLKEIPTKPETFTLVSSVQKKLQTLDSIPSLLNKVTQTLDKFTTVVENASTTTKDVNLVGQATASPAEEEKNTKDADTNLKDELVDLLGKNVVTQYYKKLLFDKYCDKMLKRKKSPKITNCEVLTKKGPITLKIYREDGSGEVI
ncbi:hypothetical protein Tco_0859647 [Tanacetum coccineum]|uniref:Uncharacterized protein n=1 Tax=Tanacetum coccineum TaxID=301880 RepID=A0ABQ5BCP6_9ASTR